MVEDVKVPVIQDDGFDDAGIDDRVIQGTLAKCVDGKWSDRDGAPIPRVLLALKCDEILQLWKNNTPAETIRSKPLPDVKELNAKTPETEWEPGIDGKPRPPWQHQFLVYLINPSDGSIFTFVNSTVGAAIGVRRLRERVKVTRMLRGVNVFPVVQLNSAPFKAKFGPKLGPEFTILEWRELGAAPLPTASPQLEHKPAEPASGKEQAAKSAFAPNMPGKPVKPVTLGEELNDEIP
jgi:hypothetical protein